MTNPSTAPSSTWGSAADRQQVTQERKQELSTLSTFKMGMALEELHAAIDIDQLEQEIKDKPKRGSFSQPILTTACQLSRVEDLAHTSGT